jgi:mannose/fructose-specific phosphotransferase system component IIA
MSEALRGVVVCHGRLAGALVEAAESISGVAGALVPVSNSGCDRDLLEQRVADAVDGHTAVVFVDLASGSCLFAVLKRLRAMPGVRVVTASTSPCWWTSSSTASSLRRPRPSGRRGGRQGDPDP